MSTHGVGGGCGRPAQDHGHVGNEGAHGHGHGGHHGKHGSHGHGHGGEGQGPNTPINGQGGDHPPTISFQNNGPIPGMPAYNTTPGSSQSLPSGAQHWLDAVNKVRQEHGVPPLTASPNLISASESNDAANNKTHDLAHHNGLINGSRGQITAYASDGETPEKAIDQWLNSPGHRAILLDPSMTHVGFSVSGAYATADFS